MVPLRYAAPGIVIALLLLPQALNFVQVVSGSGPHRRQAEGRVVSVRRTVLWLYEQRPRKAGSHASRSRCSQFDACYVATVVTPAGRRRKVALSQHDRDRVAPGNYVVVSNGTVGIFADQAAAGRSGQPLPSR